MLYPKFTFNAQITSAGNIIVINHHSKPIKQVWCFDKNGVLLNDSLQEDSYQNLKYLRLNEYQLKGDSVQEAIDAFLNEKKVSDKKREDKLNEERYGEYTVSCKIIKIDGRVKNIDVNVIATSLKDSYASAETKVWSDNKLIFDAVKTVFSNSYFND